MSRASYDQRANFKRACRLNRPRTFGALRALYQAAVLNGQKFGLYSGYSP